MLARIKKGDTVQVISGREKGKTGTVLDILIKKEKALVEKLNRVKRHMKAKSQKQQGGILEKEAPLPFSVLLPYCTKCTKGVRIKVKLTKEGEKTRICADCGGDLEGKKK